MRITGDAFVRGTNKNLHRPFEIGRILGACSVKPKDNFSIRTCLIVAFDDDGVVDYVPLYDLIHSGIYELVVQNEDHENLDLENFNK